MSDNNSHEVEDEFPNIYISNEADFTIEVLNQSSIDSQLGYEIGQFRLENENEVMEKFLTVTENKNSIS